MLDSLPTELLKMIVDELPSIDDLRRVRLVNQVLNAVATPGAFRSVGAMNKKNSAEGLVQLLETSELAQHVQEVLYRDEGANDEGNERSPYMLDRGLLLNVGHGQDVQEPLVVAFSLLAKLPALRALRLIFYPKFQRHWYHEHDLLDAYDPYPYRRYDVYDRLRLQHALLQAIADAAPARVRSLTLINLIPMHDALYETHAFHMLLEGLTRLHLAIFSEKERFNQDEHWWFKFWLYGVRDAFFPHLAGLTSLALRNDEQFQSTPVAWASVTFPRLKYVSLENVHFKDNGEEDAFVERHAATLEWLDDTTGPDCVRWVRREHADPEDKSEYEKPPSETTVR